MLVREIIYLILSVRELECALCKKNLSLTPQILERAYQLLQAGGHADPVVIEDPVIEDLS